MDSVAKALLALLGMAVVSCSPLVDSPVTYRDCDRTHLEELFDEGTPMKALYERCWQRDNAEIMPDDLTLDGGDLLIRVNATQSGHHEQWREDDQAPMLFHHLEKNFLIAARVEALNKVDSSHCLQSGNMAGLVMRQGAADWLAFLIGPFEQYSEEFDCTDEGDLPPPPTRAEFFSRGVRWSHDLSPIDHGYEDMGHQGIGEDGELDLAICRVGDTVNLYHSLPFEELKPEHGGLPRNRWESAGTVSEVFGAVDVGPTASGEHPTYEVEAHFDWVVIRDGIGNDGCSAALDAVGMPVSD